MLLLVAGSNLDHGLQNRFPVEGAVPEDEAHLIELRSSDGQTEVIPGHKSAWRRSPLISSKPVSRPIAPLRPAPAGPRQSPA